MRGISNDLLNISGSLLIITGPNRAKKSNQKGEKMFWFVFIFALLAYGTCHLASVYRERAIESGESKIGLFRHSICPTCQKCKIFVLISFIITVFTAFIVAYSRGNDPDMSFFTLGHGTWELIHVFIGLLFVIALVIYFYIHYEALAAGFKKMFQLKIQHKH